MKKIYIGFSIYQFIWTLFLRVVCVFVSIYCLREYDQSPALILIVICVCLFLILYLGDDQIIIYEDRITQSRNSFLSSLLRRKEKTIPLKQIRRAFLLPTGRPSPASVPPVVARAYLNRRIRNEYRPDPIFFELENGETTDLYTYLGKTKREKIAAHVNALVKLGKEHSA